MGYKLKRILIYPDGVTEKQVYPKYEWKPDASRTLLYLPLESDANDYSGNSISTTPSNVTYASLGGVMCANANGSSSKISVNTIPGITASLDEGTISAVVYARSYAYSSTYAKFMECARNQGFFGLKGDTTNNRFVAWSNGGYSGTAPSTSTPLNTRVVLTTTFDSTSEIVYINGEKVWEFSRTDTSQPVWGKWTNSYEIGHYIFCSRGGNNNYFNGGGRELILENIRWSDKDVVNYYQRIKAKLGI